MDDRQRPNPYISGFTSPCISDINNVPWGLPWWLSGKESALQETWVWSLIWEDPTRREAAKPERHNQQA